MGRATLAPSATTPTGAGETREARGRAPSGRVASGRVAGDRVASDRVAGDRVAGDRVASDRVPPSSEPAAERSAQPAPQGGAPFGEGVRVMRLAAPFLDVTARIAVDDDGAPTGDVDLTGDVGLAGMPVATLRWAVAGWDGAGDLVLPTVTADAATLRVTPPPGVGLAVARASVSEAAAPVSGPAASVSESAVGGPSGAGVVDEVIVLPLPSLARAGAPAGPAGALERLPGAIAEVLGALLGADLSRLFLDAGPGAVAATRVAGAPAVVSGDVVRLAPGAPAPTEPDGAHLLDAAARLWLADVEGPVEVGGRLPNPTPVVEQPATPAPAPLPAAPPVPAPPVPAPLPAERGVVRPIGADSTNNRAFGAEEAGGAEEAAGAAPPAAEPPAEEGAGVDLLMPPAPTEPGPEQQARAGGVARAARAASSSAAAMPSAAATVGEARGAVTEPDAETTARAAADLAERLGERAAPSPEIVALAERIRTAIRQRRPVDEDQLTSANPESAAREAGASVTSSVEGDAARVQGSYAEMATPPAGEPALTPTPVQPQNPAVSDPGINAGAAAPDAVPPEYLSLEADRQNVEQRASDARIERHSTEPLQGQEPFSTVREGRAELGGMAQTGPAEVAVQQEQAIAAAQADMHALQAQALAALNASRGGTVAAVAAGQGGMVGSEQQTRESVSRQAQGIFDGARTQVEALLNPLSRTALARWDAGVTRLSTQFREHLARVQRWIDERHSGIGGAIVGAWDAVTGLPGWVTREYDDAERAFGDGVASLLLGISADVNTVIAAAEAVIDAARTRIRDLFASLPAELQEWAAGEQARFEGQLDGLAARAAQTRTSFVTDVSQRATQAVSEVQAEVERLRTAARGLIGRIADAIGAFLDDPVRAIIDGLLSLVGIPPASFWALVDRISQVISDIADDPETFINNLVAGLRQGFQQFFDRFGTHVLNGFWAWLFSGLGSVGVQIPSDFSVRSLVTFVLQVMGITWPRIREILVRHIGAENVELIEKVWELVSTLIQRGPEGLVEMIRERLDPATIVQTILRAAVEYLVERLIQAVVMRVLGMLNPVGAVLQAIELIYRVLRWVFENAARIFALVETVVNGVADVMAGRIGQMAGAIERALAGLIPPVIDFLAGLLGLGDLPEQIAAVIGRLQTMVLGVVERILVALITRGRALLASLGLGGGADDGARPGAEGEADTELGTTVRFTAAGESHRLYVQQAGEDAALMVASVPEPIATKIAGWRAAIKPGQPHAAKKDQAKPLLDRLGPMADAADAKGDDLAKKFLAAKAKKDGTPPPSDDDLENRERAIATVLDELFTLFGETPDPTLRFAGQLETVHPAAKPVIEKALAAAGAALPATWAGAKATAQAAPEVAAVEAAPLNKENPFGGTFAHAWGATATLRALREAREEMTTTQDKVRRRRITSVMERIKADGGLNETGAGAYLTAYKVQIHAAETPFDAPSPTPVERMREVVWRASLQGAASSRLREGMFARIVMGSGPPPGPDLPSRIREEIWTHLGAAQKAQALHVRAVGEAVYMELTPSAAQPIADLLAAEVAASTDPDMKKCLEWWQKNILNPEFHHAWPQWLLGAAEQTRLHLPRALHNFDGITVGAENFPGGFHQIFNAAFAVAFPKVWANGDQKVIAGNWAAHVAQHPGDKAVVAKLLVDAYVAVLGPFGTPGRQAVLKFVAEARATFPSLQDPP